MGRIFKALLLLIVLGGIGLVSYAYLGDMSAPVQQITQPVTLDAQ